MATKKVQLTPAETEKRKTFWQPESARGVSEAGRKWQEENAEAIKSWNEWVDKNGLPLEKYRQF